MKNRVRAAATAALLCALASAALPAQGPKSEAGPRAAAALYAKHCATCHGKDGRAKTFKAKFNHARDLSDPAWSDERVFNSISLGRGKKMPAFGKKLSTEQLESLVAHVRGLKK